MKTLYGFKDSQEPAFTEAGRRLPVSWIKVEPNIVVAVAKNKTALVGFGSRATLPKPQRGMLKKWTLPTFPRYFREIPIEGEVTVGQEISLADVFRPGDKLKVTGVSKGKGFAGVVKRHGFAGGPKTHGQSTKQRHPGSIGQTTTPGRVYKGKRMAGHLGGRQVSILGLEVFAVKPEEKLLAVTGLVPGAKGSLVQITKSDRAPK